MALILQRWRSLHRILPVVFGRRFCNTTKLELKHRTVETKITGQITVDMLYPFRSRLEVSRKYIDRYEAKPKQQTAIANVEVSPDLQIDQMSISDQTTDAPDITDIDETKLKHKNQVEYDFIVDCDRIQDLNDNGWDVYASKNDLWYTENKGYFFDERRSIRRVAITGVYNTGKTYFLSKLCGIKLPDCDDSLHTTGISIKRLSAEDKIIVIDTAGSNSSIEIADDTALSDKITSEKILQNTVYEITNFHICVVNELTWPDQHHFEALYKRIKQSQSENRSCSQQWPLIVVHNFRTKSLKDLKLYLLNDIQKAYKYGKFKCNQMDIADVKGQLMKTLQMFIDAPMKTNIKYGWTDVVRQIKTSAIHEIQSRFHNVPRFWFDSRGGHSNQLTHFFLVNSDTLVGEAYNQFVFDQIKEIITTTPMGSDTPTNNSNSHNIYNEKDVSVSPEKFCINDLFEAIDKNVTQYVQFVKEEQINGNKIETIVKPEQSVVPNLVSIAEINDEGIDAFEVYDEPINVTKLNNKNKNDIPQIKIILDPYLINKENAKIKLRDSGDLEYNALFIGATSWVLKYDVRYKENICAVIMELPGTIRMTQPYILQNEANQPHLIIEGERLQEDVYNDSAAEVSQRKFGKFEFKIRINKEFGNEQILPAYSAKNGVVTVEIMGNKQPPQPPVVEIY